MHAGAFHRDTRCGSRHGAVVLRRTGDAPLTDAGALHDPLVVGLESHRRKLVIAEDTIGRAPAHAGELHERTLHALTPVAADSPSRSPMCASSREAAARAATLTAFFRARADDFPWAMMLIPFTPNNGAPPYAE